MTIFEIYIFGLKIAPTYYGLMYALTFLYGVYFMKSLKKYSDSQIESLFVYMFLGVILGGRLGYILLYDFSGFIHDPFSLVRIWEGGMSFHGGVIGVLLSGYIFSCRNKVSRLILADDLVMIAPVGIFLGRMGNYINKELLGFPYNGPFAVSTHAGSFFPSPLLEAILEGIVLFVILSYIYRKKAFHGQIIALFFIFYGFFRICIEIFIRSPDSHLGYIIGPLSLGSLLSIPMLFGGVIAYYLFSLRREQ